MDKKLIQDYCKICFNTPEGKSVLKWLDDTYCDGNIFRKDNPTETAHRLGKRDLVRDLKKMVNEEIKKGSQG